MISFLLHFINFDIALVILSTISILITIFYYNRDRLFRTDKKSIFGSFIFVVAGASLILYRNPTIENLLPIVIKQGLAEEIVFRLGMLGIVRKYIDSTPLSKNAWKFLVGNSIFFCFMHFQYLSTPLSYPSVFVASLVGGYLFLKIGIIASIISHSLWNLYLNTNAMAVVMVTILIYEIFKNSTKIKVKT